VVLLSPICSWKTSVSTPSLHLPLSARLDEISWSLRAPSNPFFWPIWRSWYWYPQRPSAAQPLRSPNFFLRRPAGHGWAPGGAQPACGGAPPNRLIAVSASPRAPSSETRAHPAPLPGPASHNQISSDLDLRVIVCWLAAWCSRSIWFACGASFFFLARGTPFGFGLPTALPSLLGSGYSLSIWIWVGVLSAIAASCLIQPTQHVQLHCIAFA
jgi:hypothetical protein